MSFQPASVLPEDLRSQRWVWVGESGLLCPQQGLFWTQAELPYQPLPEHIHALGTWHGQGYVAVEARDEPTRPARRLRELLMLASAEEQAVLVRAAQVVLWSRQYRFCSRCGQALQTHAEERARVCTSCQEHYYPRINPCIIVLVRRGRSMLLAQGVRFVQPFFSTLAGFIEAGESAEEAVHREVMEEVGVRIDHLRYVSSQSWPFPQSLMLGFMADYQSGEIHCDPREIRAARWVEPGEDILLPPPLSIARQLIELHCREL